MYNLSKNYNNGKTSESTSQTLEEIEDFLENEYHQIGFDYKIHKQGTNELIDEGHVESSDGLIEASMNDMFPDEDSMAGFDWTFE